MMKSNCPSCGGPIEYEEKYTQLISCEYCNNSIAVVDNSLKLDQEIAPLAKVPTRLEIGKELVHSTGRYRIMGLARFQYGKGFWDEWHLLNQSDNSIAWYTEDEGDYILFDEKKVLGAATPPVNPKPGINVELENNSISVRESGTAKLIGVKGQIAWTFPVHQEFSFVDGVCAGKMVIVSWLPDKTVLSSGVPVRYKEIEIKNHGE